MSDSHEEQLLSDLLSHIAREDAPLDAPHLEARVMSMLEGASQPMVRLKADPTDLRARTYLKAAAIIVAVLVPAIMWMRPTRPIEVTANHSNSTTPATLSTPTTRPTATTPPTPTTLSTPATRPTPKTRPTPQTPVLSDDEFIPLLPLTEQELTGSFQLVRVQMPRASLGTLRSPLEHPDELVEADVLLGADGTARAIRLSTSGSVYPWRTR